jgi:DNA-binding response OmpR family regulator
MERKLLWADDDEELTSLCRRYFERDRFEVRTVADGIACLSVLREWGPDVLVLDDRLPGTNTTEVLASLSMSSPIQVIVSGDSAATRSPDTDSRNVIFVRKPFHLRHILDLVSVPQPLSM